MEQIYMERCLQLAENGIGLVEPNPMVGCVIVKDNKIITEGYHQQYGSSHAEVNAINQLPSDTDYSSCILYVNLEPCAHTGKTPPCAELIIKKGFKKVVIAQLDPNPLVYGKGVEMLKNAGIDVEIGLLEKEAQFLNRKFNTFYSKKRPYIFLKWAQSADGFMAPQLEDPNYNTLRYISNIFSQRLVHQYRATHQSIMVGTNTAFYDNPKLNVRHWAGRDPIRIVWDPQQRLLPHLHVFDGSIKTLIIVDQYFKSNHHWEKENVEYIYIDFSKNPVQKTLEVLYEKDIQSVMVEGGKMVLQSFIDTHLWDEIVTFTAPDKNLYSGVKAPIIKQSPTHTENISGDIKRVYLPNA